MENKARNSRGHLIVCGAGSIGQYIAGELQSTKRDFVVVETGQELAAKAMASLKSAILIEGDATNNDVLVKAGIANASGLFAVTGDDNQNLVISLTAKQLNPALRVVAECTDVANGEKMKKAGADAVVSPGLIGGLRMASEMVRPTVVSFLDIMLRDTDRNLRVEEIGLKESWVGKTIADLGLKSFRHSLLLALRTHQDWVYNPPDTHVIGPRSAIVVMTTPDGRSELEQRLT
jgi:voltage-gated potassium channel